MFDTFEIWLNESLIDEVDFKRGSLAEEVKKHLVETKGFDPEIKVRLACC